MIRLISWKRQIRLRLDKTARYLNENIRTTVVETAVWRACEVFAEESVDRFLERGTATTYEKSGLRRAEKSERASTRVKKLVLSLVSLVFLGDNVTRNYNHREMSPQQEARSDVTLYTFSVCRLVSLSISLSFSLFLSLATG